MRDLEKKTAAFRRSIEGMVPAIQATTTSISEFGSTLGRMSAWQNAHGLVLDGSEAGTGDPSQTGVEAVRGPSVSAEWIDEIHGIEGRV